MQKITFNDRKVRLFMENFYKASAIHIGAHNIEKNVYIEGTWQRSGFCHTCRKISGEVRKCLCDKADKEYLKKTELTLERQIYECPLGFAEAILPVIEDETIIYCFFIGRVLIKEKSDEDFRNKLNILASLDDKFKDLANIGRLKEEYDKITRYTPERFTAICDILELCAQSLYDTKAVRVNTSSLFDEFQHHYSLMKYDADVSSAKIAKEMHISEASLNRCIRKQTGLSFTGYVTSQKIKTAKKLLLSGDMKINQIASAVGINDANYFSRVFKKVTGMTCRQFRNSHDE